MYFTLLSIIWYNQESLISNKKQSMSQSTSVNLDGLIKSHIKESK